MTKRFAHLDSSGTIVKRYDMKTARCVALHVARNTTGDVIPVYDNELKKIHVYRGSKRILEDHEHTPFTRRMGISTKTVISKIGYGSNVSDIESSLVSILNS